MLAALAAKGDFWPPDVERLEASKELIEFAFIESFKVTRRCTITFKNDSENEFETVSYHGNE